MTLDVRLPKWGMSMDSGSILEWRVAPGDAVQEGDVIALVETAKTINELLAPGTGIVIDILAQAGEDVEPGTTVAKIDAGDG